MVRTNRIAARSNGKLTPTVTGLRAPAQHVASNITATSECSVTGAEPSCNIPGVFLESSQIVSTGP